MRCAPAVLLALLLTGCRTAMEPTFDGPVYPDGLTKLETLNVQVGIGAHDLTLTNGTASPVGPGTLWINRWFATEFEELAPGDRVVVPLESFEDENGLPPRGGGFFATRDRTEIVLVELITERGTNGLLLLGGSD